MSLLQVIGWENIELISDRPLETMLDEFARLKKEFPRRILIASIMEEYNRVCPRRIFNRHSQSPDRRIWIIKWSGHRLGWPCSADVEAFSHLEMKRKAQHSALTQQVDDRVEPHSQDAWEELIQRCEDVGVDAFEINFSCPHGMPERKMGMAMGQDCDLLGVRATLHTTDAAHAVRVRILGQ